MGDGQVFLWAPDLGISIILRGLATGGMTISEVREDWGELQVNVSVAQPRALRVLGGLAR